MRKLLKLIPVILILLCCACVAIIGLSDYQIGDVKQLPEYSDHGIEGLAGRAGGDVPPGGGSCSSIGKPYEDNPFSGWPVNYHPGDWSTIASWFCDPNYFEGYTHWGIDLARYDWSESIYGVEAVITAEKAIVEAAAYDAGFGPKAGTAHNYGMGNYVKVQALSCKTFIESEIGVDLDGDGKITNVPVERCAETGWYAYYFHLLTVTVAKGDEVERGDVVGLIDSTGTSTGDHLHYQIKNPDGVSIDPAPSMSVHVDYDNAMREQPRWDRP